MSKAAQNIMAKYGWRTGEGLGKDRDGVVTYVKVVRRDPKTATGLGHVAEAGGSTEAATVELDEVYRTLPSSLKRGPPVSASDSDADEVSPPSKQRRTDTSPSESSTSDSDSECSGEDHTKPLTDEELFRRCGGVRLGRGGRHRFFDGKLERVARSHGHHPPAH